MRGGGGPSVARMMVAATVLVGIATFLGVPASAGQRYDAGPVAHAVRAGYPKPIFTADRTGDPSVVKTRNGLVMVATGPLVRRARWDAGKGWRWIGPALKRLPSWARKGDVWAADLARVGDHWLLYYSAPVRGLGKWGRCIGVARAATAYDKFRPVGKRPLVCPARAKTPTAADPIPGGAGLPKRGAIDPSLFVDDDGSFYLLYKTDGLPASIRLLPLTAAANEPADGATSVELVRSKEVIENPVVVRRGEDYHLFTSEKDFSRCAYRQVWRRSTDLSDWSGSSARVLLSRGTTGGLCGPAGGDLLVDGSRTTLYFHGWVRTGTTRPPKPPFWAGHRGPDARRVLYGARLRFVDGTPEVVRFLK